MDEEELYRLMNEEDDLYMGDLEAPQQPDDKKPGLPDNNGCAGLLLFAVVLILHILL
jgi:hypothetical protein